jgi:hypothetical protein
VTPAARLESIDPGIRPARKLALMLSIMTFAFSPPMKLCNSGNPCLCPRMNTTTVTQPASRHSGSNGTESSLKESGKLLDHFGRVAENHAILFVLLFLPVNTPPTKSDYPCKQHVIASGNESTTPEKAK